MGKIPLGTGPQRPPVQGGSGTAQSVGALYVSAPAHDVAAERARCVAIAEAYADEQLSEADAATKDGRWLSEVVAIARRYAALEIAKRVKNDKSA